MHLAIIFHRAMHNYYIRLQFIGTELTITYIVEKFFPITLAIAHARCALGLQPTVECVCDFGVNVLLLK